MIPPSFYVVVNQSCEQEFKLSEDAVRWILTHGYPEISEVVVMEFGDIFKHPSKRHDTWLIKAVETLGPKASAGKSNLQVVRVYGSSYTIVKNGYCEVAIPDLGIPELKTTSVE